MMNGTQDKDLQEKLQHLKEEIDQLPIEEKARLVQDILQGSGLQVVMGGGNFFSADIVLQIHTGSADQLGEIFRALADRVGKEKKLKIEEI